jgi:prevent-host-death family protein
MKRKVKRTGGDYPESPDNAAQIRESAAHYGLSRDVMGVREAKDQLSSILQRAARGEEIVITSDGAPVAMLVRYQPAIKGRPFYADLARLRAMPMTPDSTPGIRAERDSGS